MIDRLSFSSRFPRTQLVLALVAAVFGASAGGCNLRPAEPGEQPWSTRDQSRPSAESVERTIAASALPEAEASAEAAVPSVSTSVSTAGDERVAQADGQRTAPAPRGERAVAGEQSRRVPQSDASSVDDREVLRRRAITLLRRASESTNDQIRVHTVEAMQFAPDELESVLRSALGDANRGVRFAAAMMVGKLRLSSIAHLAEPLVDDESQSVRAAAIFAMYQCGREVSLDPLGAMLLSADPEVKGNAVMVLGELGNPSAIPMLREAARSHSRRMSINRQRVIDLQIAEAMVRLGDEDQLDVIRAALFAPAEQGEFAAMACMIAGRLRDEAYGSALHDMAVREGRDARPAEVRLAAAFALAEMTPERAPVQVPLAYIRHESLFVRAQAAWSLGAFPSPVVPGVLAELMDDANPLVQVSAAGGMLRWLQQNRAG